MRQVVIGSQSNAWINRLISAANVHIYAIKIAVDHNTSTLPAALCDALESTGGFVSRAYMAEVSCYVEFTDGSSHRSKGMVPVNVDDEQRGSLLSIYDIWRKQLVAINPQLAARFPDVDSVMTESVKKAEAANSMCFVATACFGSGDHDSVIELRKFRDKVLKSSSIGRAFIRAYYRISPTFADLIYDHRGLKYVVKVFLCVPAAFVAKIILQEAPGKQKMAESHEVK